MSYYIDIIDKESPDTKLDYRFASASGITLEWNGGDAKDEVLIVGTNLKYDILTTSAEDLAFVEFFTGNENRFLVQVKKSSDDGILWQGYLLPDQYSEPYKNGAFFVSFIASCGLGRLKGKYLPDEYYEREKSVIAILCQIIKMTNLGLDVFFAPAIENSVQKDWNQIFIDTADFKEKEKKNDAYKILETLLKDKQCVVYQADNRWYIEGLNQRHLKEVLYKKYTENGVYVSDVVFNRLAKKITALVEPTITVIPPYNEISVTHKKIEPAFPKTIAKEKNDGWAVVTGVKGEVYATDWVGHNGYHAKAIKPNYEVRLFTKSHDSDGATSISYSHDDTKYISLKKKLYFDKSQKVKIKMSFSIPGEAKPSNMNLWRNPFKYEIIYNNAVMHTNWLPTSTANEWLIFGDDRKVTLDFEKIITEEGLLDIKLWRPFGKDDDTKISSIILSEFEVSVIGFNEEEIIMDLINDEFTIDKEIELTYADDKSGFSKGFRLAKLKEETAYAIDIEIPILYSVPNNPKLIVVSLEGANLIKENLYNTYVNGNLVNIVNVFYNYENGEQMVIELGADYVSGILMVKNYAVDDVVGSRANWVQWTDAVYKIEKNSYAKTVANIFRRMFSVAVEKIDLTALNAVKFNDIIVFNYVSEKQFFPLNVVWNLDENKTELRLARSFYKDSGSTPGDDNVPPIVLAGEDLYISDAQSTANLLATAYDPDGFIVSQNWTKITGGFGDVIVTPNQLATSLQNLTEDLYTYKIEITDNDGATAFDTVNVIRLKDYTLSFQEVFYDRVEGSIALEIRKLKLICTPDLPVGFLMNVKGVLETIISIEGISSGWDAYTGYEIEKNGAVIEKVDINSSTGNDPLLLSYVKNDQIFVTIEAHARGGSPSPGYYANSSIGMSINEAEMIIGQGNILGLPIVYAAQAQVISE